MVRPHSWAKWEKPAKNEIEKIRETDWSYLTLIGMSYESKKNAHI